MPAPGSLRSQDCLTNKPPTALSPSAGGSAAQSRLGSISNRASHDAAEQISLLARFQIGVVGVVAAIRPRIADQPDRPRGCRHRRTAPRRSPESRAPWCRPSARPRAADRGRGRYIRIRRRIRNRPRAAPCFGRAGLVIGPAGQRLARWAAVGTAGEPAEFIGRTAAPPPAGRACRSHTLLRLRSCAPCR